MAAAGRTATDSPQQKGEAGAARVKGKAPRAFPPRAKEGNRRRRHRALRAARRCGPSLSEPPARGRGPGERVVFSEGQAGRALARESAPMVQTMRSKTFHEEVKNCR